MYSSDDLNGLLDRLNFRSSAQGGDGGELWAVVGPHSEYFIACVETDTGPRDDIAEQVRLINVGRSYDGDESMSATKQREYVKKVSDLSTPTSAFRLFVRVFRKDAGLAEDTLVVGSPEEVVRALFADVMGVFVAEPRDLVCGANADFPGTGPGILWFLTEEI